MAGTTAELPYALLRPLEKGATIGEARRMMTEDNIPPFLLSPSPSPTTSMFALLLRLIFAGFPPTSPPLSNTRLGSRVQHRSVALGEIFFVTPPRASVGVLAVVSTHT